MPEKKYDAIVVGSGATGGFAAKELAERGLEVAGPRGGAIPERTVVPRAGSHEGCRLAVARDGGSQGTAQAGERVVVLSRKRLPVRERQKEPLHVPAGRLLSLAPRTERGRQVPVLGPRRRPHVGLRLQGGEPRRIRRRLADLATTISFPTTIRWRNSWGSSAPVTASPICPTASTSNRQVCRVWSGNSRRRSSRPGRNGRSYRGATP